MFLPTAEPFDGGALLAFLAARAIPGVEEVVGGTYRRTLALPHGPATVAATPRADGVDLAFTPADPADAALVAARVRHLFGLDQDPAAVRAALGDDPVLGPLLAARPGLRVPGALDGFEIAVRAILGQQISVAAARVLAGRITARLGARVEGDAAAPAARLEPPPLGAAASGDATALTHLLPTPAALAAAPDDAFPMPRSRIRTLRGLAAADPRLDAPEDAAALTALWGVGPWTAGYVALRLGDPDVFLEGDVAVRSSLARLGASVEDAPRWAPFRSQAVLHLWANLANPS